MADGSRTKDDLLESINRHLHRLEHTELASLAQRLDAGTLRFQDLVVSASGGFGFQKEARTAPAAGSRAEKAADGALEKIRDHITSIVK